MSFIYLFTCSFYFGCFFCLTSPLFWFCLPSFFFFLFVAFFSGFCYFLLFSPLICFQPLQDQHGGDNAALGHRLLALDVGHQVS